MLQLASSTEMGLGHKNASPGLQSQLVPTLATCKHTVYDTDIEMWVASFVNRIASV